jgi:acyl carrier protein
VRLKKNSTNDACLVAYITTYKKDSLTNALDLCAFVKQKLPRQMVPSSFIQLERMPLSQNGKVDRLALDKADGQLLKSDKPFKEPSSSLEQNIMSTWLKVLNQSEVSIDDDFFDDLGGDSLSALLFIESFAKSQQKEIDIRLLYESSTVAKLAVRLSDAILAQDLSVKLEHAKNQISDDFKQVLLAQRSYIKTWKGARISEDSLLFMLNSNGTKPPLFWCFQGYHEFSQLAKHLGEDQPLVGMRSGHLIMEYTQANVEAIALTYVSEMVNILPVADFLVGGNCQGGRIAQAIAICLKGLGRPVKKLIMMEQSIFEVYNGTLALIFGESSKYNPYLEHTNPQEFLNDYYDNFTIDLTSGGHGEFFSDVNITSLSNLIHLKINEA